MFAQCFSAILRKMSETTADMRFIIYIELFDAGDKNAI
jgi:hypothetical protein